MAQRDDPVRRSEAETEAHLKRLEASGVPDDARFAQTLRAQFEIGTPITVEVIPVSDGVTTGDVFVTDRNERMRRTLWVEHEQRAPSLHDVDEARRVLAAVGQSLGRGVWPEVQELRDRARLFHIAVLHEPESVLFLIPAGRGIAGEPYSASLTEGLFGDRSQDADPVGRLLNAVAFGLDGAWLVAAQQVADGPREMDAQRLAHDDIGKTLIDRLVFALEYEVHTEYRKMGESPVRSTDLREAEHTGLWLRFLSVALGLWKARAFSGAPPLIEYRHQPAALDLLMGRVRDENAELSNHVAHAIEPAVRDLMAALDMDQYEVITDPLGLLQTVIIPAINRRKGERAVAVDELAEAATVGLRRFVESLVSSGMVKPEDWVRRADLFEIVAELVRGGVKPCPWCKADIGEMHVDPECPWGRLVRLAQTIPEHMRRRETLPGHEHPIDNAT